MKLKSLSVKLGTTAISPIEGCITGISNESLVSMSIAVRDYDNPLWIADYVVLQQNAEI